MRGEGKNYIGESRDRIFIAPPHKFVEWQYVFHRETSCIIRLVSGTSCERGVRVTVVTIFLPENITKRPTGVRFIYRRRTVHRERGNKLITRDEFFFLRARGGRKWCFTRGFDEMYAGDAFVWDTLWKKGMIDVKYEHQEMLISNSILWWLDGLFIEIVWFDSNIYVWIVIFYIYMIAFTIQRGWNKYTRCETDDTHNRKNDNFIIIKKWIENVVVFFYLFPGKSALEIDDIMLFKLEWSFITIRHRIYLATAIIKYAWRYIFFIKEIKFQYLIRYPDILYIIYIIYFFNLYYFLLYFNFY